MTLIGPGIIITMTDTRCECPKCGHKHDIGDDIIERGQKIKRGYTTIKCEGCKTKLSVFDDCISRTLSLDVYMTKKELEKWWKEQEKLNPPLDNPESQSLILG